MTRIAVFLLALVAWLTPADAQFFNPAMYFPTATGSVIGNPTSIGTGSNNGGGTTVTFTTTANIISGNLLVCSIASSGASHGTVSTVSDGTNSLGLAVSVVNGGGNLDGELWYKANASAVGSGATMTVTMSGSGENGLAVACAQVSGLTATPLDKTASSGAGTTSPSVATGTLTQAKELIITSVSNIDNITPSEPGSFTRISSVISANTNAATDYTSQIVNSTNSVTYAPTLTGATHNPSTLIASFKGS